MLGYSGFRVALVLMSLAVWPSTIVLAQEQADSVVTSGFGKIALDGLVQVWYLENQPEFDRTFRIRRTELRLTGTFTRRIKWTVMIDPSRALDFIRDSTFVNDSIVIPTVEVNQTSRILQDAYITVDISRSLNIDVGQRKVPLSFEGLQSSAELKTIERALMFSDRRRGGDLADVRDIGVMAYGGITSHIDYQAGVFNGLGENQNNVNTKDALAVVARVVFKPGVPGLQFGVSGGVNGRADAAERRKLPFVPRNRLGVEGYFQGGRWTAQSELMTGRDDEQTRLGTYALAAYHITSITEIVAQIDYFDPDLSRSDDRLTASELDFLLGANFYVIENNLKLQANAVVKTFGDAGPASRLTLLFNFQVSW